MAGHTDDNALSSVAWWRSVGDKLPPAVRGGAEKLAIGVANAMKQKATTTAAEGLQGAAAANSLMDSSPADPTPQHSPIFSTVAILLLTALVAACLHWMHARELPHRPKRVAGSRGAMARTMDPRVPGSDSAAPATASAPAVVTAPAAPTPAPTVQASYVDLGATHLAPAMARTMMETSFVDVTRSADDQINAAADDADFEIVDRNE